MSTHRGCKEMDIILGRFAESEINTLNQEEIVMYESLLMESDDILFKILGNIISNKQLELDEALLYAKDILFRIADFYN